MDNTFVVLTTYGPILMGESDRTYVSNVSLSEEAAWAFIGREIEENYTKNEFGDPYICIYPALKFVRVTMPIGCRRGGTKYTHHEYKIIKRKGNKHYE